MNLGYFHYPAPVNELVLSYAPGSPEKATLKQTLATLKGQEADIPMYIGGEEVRTGNTIAIHPPHSGTTMDDSKNDETPEANDDASRAVGCDGGLCGNVVAILVSRLGPMDDQAEIERLFHPQRVLWLEGSHDARSIRDIILPLAG